MALVYKVHAYWLSCTVITTYNLYVATVHVNTQSMITNITMTNISIYIYYNLCELIIIMIIFHCHFVPDRINNGL